MALSAIDAISPAFGRMRHQLFQPFRFGQWIRFAIVGFLAGEMGGCNLNFPFNLPNSSRSQQLQASPAMGAAALLFVLLLVLLGIVLGIAFLYVSSRMRFVLFDSIVSGTCEVRKFWRLRGTPALRYFFWQILFAVSVLLLMLLVFAPPVLLAASAGWFASPRDHLLPIVVGGALVVVLFLLMIFAAGCIHVLTKDFVVPVMALEDTTTIEGWRRLRGLMSDDPWGFAGYVGMKLVLSIVISVLMAVLYILLFLVFLIPVGGVGLIGMAAGLQWNPVTIAFAIVVGGIVVLLLMFLSALLSVPMIVFFPAYSLHFLAARYTALASALVPPPLSPTSNPSPLP